MQTKEKKIEKLTKFVNKFSKYNKKNKKIVLQSSYLPSVLYKIYFDIILACKQNKRN